MIHEEITSQALEALTEKVCSSKHEEENLQTSSTV